jgi:putative PIN family toxin of toxin-antitoxin system
VQVSNARCRRQKCYGFRLFGGALKNIIVLWKSGKFTLLVSEAIAEEYRDVLKRPKFKIERTEMDDFFVLLLDRAEFVTSTETIDVIADDPSDNKFIEAAIAGEANLIVSGDKHLLELKSFRDISIITAREFMRQLAEQ